MPPTEAPAFTSAPSIHGMASEKPFIEAPAPWPCKGECFWFSTYVHAKRGAYPPPAAFGELEQGTAFADPTVAGDYEGGLAGVIVFRYTETPVGPYDEIMWIPGKFTVPAGGPGALRITRLYVSTKESVYNGRKNWNIAKTVAHFDFTPSPKENNGGLPYSKISVSDPSTPEQPFFVADLAPSLMTSVVIPLKSTYMPISMYMAHPPLPQSPNWREDALVGTEEWRALLPVLKGKASIFWTKDNDVKPQRISPSKYSLNLPTRSTERRKKPHLVILGSGWGGYEVLRGVNKRNWKVTVLSPNNYFNFTPLLASCAVGTLEFRAAVEPVRRFTPEVTAYQAWCDSIEQDSAMRPCHATACNKDPSFKGLQSKYVTLDPFCMNPDAYIDTTHPPHAAFNVPGVKEHAHFLKDIKDARAIRTRVLECFEQAAHPTVTDIERRGLLHFCIVGGGPTGVEFAAELHDLLHTDMKRHYPALANLAKISLFDVAPNILGGFDSGLQEYATKKFKREGIRLLTQRHVERVEAGKLFVKEEGEVHFGILVWSTGLAPNPLIQSITEVEKMPKTHNVITDEHLNVIMKDPKAVNSDVFTIGDAATVQGNPLPATAQVANQKAKYLTAKLNKIVRDKMHTTPFKFNNAGSLAYLAWLLWRSAYFTQTVSIRNKILVPTYWFINWIFGRDLTRF
ncbi:hypothetical protein EUX98_g2351 [Antrodiella citrinella]|uniref:Uncharacterized protein n=1 Tax=Antrodiella citrinella TaxID=2447956 RepID=A0A4S4MZ89_9APHY|nr:hypothetical protein EUX98_g2351 [Antrodiella citrinella]